MRYVVSNDFTKLSETAGTIQNVGNIYSVEVSDKAEADSGILLYPLNKISFKSPIVYVRCTDSGGWAEIRVVSFVGGTIPVADTSSTVDKSEDEPNTEFTLANLKAANFFWKTGSYSNQIATKTLDANKTYYLNFGYAKDASTDSNDDRFYIHSIRVTPEIQADSKVDYMYNFALGVDSINQVRYGRTSIAAGGQISMPSSSTLSGSFNITGSPTFSGYPTFTRRLRSMKQTSSGLTLVISSTA